MTRRYDQKVAYIYRFYHPWKDQVDSDQKLFEAQSDQAG